MSPGGWRLLLSASEIIGGAVGAVVFIAQALDSARPVWHTAFAVLFCAVSAVAGWRLLRRLTGALGLSIAVQAAQVLWIWMPGAAYRMTSGIALVGSYTTGRGPDAIVGATAAFRIGLPDPGAGIGAGINLFAVVALVALIHVRRASRLTTA